MLKNIKGRDLKRIAILSFFWMTFSALLAFYELFLFWGNGLSVNVSVANYVLPYVGATFFASIFGGGVLVLWLEKSLRKKTYGQVLLGFLFWFTLIYFFAHVVGSVLGNTQFFNLSLFDDEVQSNIVSYFTSFNFLRGYFVWAGVSVVTIIALQVNKKYGPGVFRNFLLGRYFHPKKEERIFMFLDLKGSTSIAEKLGEEKFFNFIKDFYEDSTPAILNSKGEICQYIGDEIMISWEMEKGLQSAHCIKCFFELESIFEGRKSDYLKKYEVVPKFKAGLHGGFVMAGEVGVVKHDIVYSGDVINTAARIQGECNKLGVNILLSQYLWNKLIDTPVSYSPKKMGEIKLRGKAEKVELVTVEKNS